MAAVPQKTLNWLWDVLRREYRDPQRAYSDLAQALALFPAFAPRTDVYTSEDGVSALLLHINGTIPVNFRGNQYRFPVAVWLPHAYPYESPILYVTPTDDMVIRPGQHVSGSDGRIYHPYLARWREAWDKSTIADLLKLLGDVFAREPPVMSRQQMSLHQAQIVPQGQQPPPRPPLPGEQRPPSARPPSIAGGPPLPPPKQTNQVNRPSSQSAASPELLRSKYDTPPPLPGQGQGPVPRPQSMAFASPQSSQSQPTFHPQRQSSLRQSFPAQQTSQSVQYQHQGQSVVVPSLPIQGHQPQFPSQIPQHQQHQHQRGPSLSQSLYAVPQPQSYHLQQPHHQSKASTSAAKRPQTNLLDESPFDISLPSSNHANIPTPRIPPNPEKQHILQTIQSTLLSTLQHQISQSSSAVGPLQSQHGALQSAHQTLQQELNQLKAFQSQLQQNVTSLTSTISSAERTIASAQNESKPNKTPAIDDLIIPPTVVARQLYDSVAEQRGYEAAIMALTEGFVRGRIGGGLWERKTRECAREEFRRKWLVKRVGKGMGLDVSGLLA